MKEWPNQQDKSMGFSVAMCVYGGDNAEHFDAAINSVIEQSRKPSELVITVDGPIPDSICDVLEKYRILLNDEAINYKVIRLEKNLGHGEARRKCLENCSYDLIALMDSDDISTSNRFQKEMEVFEANPEVSIVGSHVAEFFDNNPDVIKSRRVVKLTDSDIKKDMKYRSPMNQPTVMFKRSDVDEVGGYIDWFCNEDYYLWIRLALENKIFANIDDCLVKMRIDAKSYKRRGGLKYYKSEKKIQSLMLTNGIISKKEYLMNVAKRFVV